MECNSGFNAVLQQEMPICTGQATPSSVQSLDTSVQPTAATVGLATQFSEYAALLLTLSKLYFQGRVLVMQNFILSCKLQMWELAFVYFKLQIFFVRLANGFPLGQCWPKK
jgi:hypothetical protein